MVCRRTNMKLSDQKRRILTATFILASLYVILKLGGPPYYDVCIEDPDIQNRTGLEDVRPLPRFNQQNYQSTSLFNSRHKQSFIPSKRTDLNFTHSENNYISTCIKNYPVDFEKGRADFWSGTHAQIRREHHTYLVAGESIIIEVGGNVGDDAQVFLDKYNPRHYVILEPIKLLYRRLRRRFENYNNVYLYNVGLGAKYDTFMVKMEGNDGDAISSFSVGTGEGTCSLKVANATDFFVKLAVGNYRVDLIAINCEGCEYDLLETLISTDLIYQFKHIQFGTHLHLKNLHDPVKRYCQLQTWLSRSHTLTYQFKFLWETWKLKEL